MLERYTIIKEFWKYFSLKTSELKLQAWNSGLWNLFSLLFVTLVLIKFFTWCDLRTLILLKRTAGEGGEAVPFCDDWWQAFDVQGGSPSVIITKWDQPLHQGPLPVLRSCVRGQPQWAFRSPWLEGGSIVAVTLSSLLIITLMCLQMMNIALFPGNYQFSLKIRIEVIWNFRN